MFEQNRNYWQKIISIGQTPTMDFDERARLAIMNAICGLSLGVVILFSFIFALLGSFSALQSLGILPVLLGVLWLNKNECYAVSRFVLTFGSMAVLFILALLDRRTGTEYTILAVGCVSAFFYTSRGWMVASFFSACVLYAAYVIIDHRLPFIPNPAIDYLLTQTIVMFITVSTLFAAMFQFRIVINRYSSVMKEINQEMAVKNEELVSLNEGLDEAVIQRTQEISNQYEELEFQKEELLSQKEELDSIVEELNKRNSSLDTTVKELAQRNYELDQIVYRLSHDLRGPLTSITGLLHLMDGDQEKDFTQDCLGRIGRRIHDMDTVLHSMTSFAEVMIAKLAPENVDVTALIQEAIQPLSTADGFGEMKFLILPQSPDCGRIVSDPQKLRILFQCICANTIAFRKTGTENVVKITIGTDGALVTVDVADTGIGIEESVRANVFDMFYRGSSQSKGSGLGLYIARETARRLKGVISLADNGNGTTVRVVLPVGNRP